MWGCFTFRSWCPYRELVLDTTFDRRAVTVPADTTPCFSEDTDERRELSALFDATDRASHRAAAALCEACPFRHGCQETARAIASSPGSWAGTPEGTWGGELYVAGKRKDKSA